ncbi:MAG: sigma 54-interacting transcriptional regulator [Nitrospirota bacterium]
MRKMRQGNEIYITGSPIFCDGKITHVAVNIRDVTELQRLQEQVSRLTALYLSAPEENRIQSLAGENVIVESPVMKRIIDLVVRVSQVDSVVLIMGESGTGKEVLARLIHRLSTRNKSPFISINCGAIPENLLESELFGYEKGSFTGALREGKPGLFELANTGTIFLDEIAEMPLNLQVKLLKILQDMEAYRLGGVRPVKFDVRVIAATNRNLRELVREGKFREDLFYRLYVVPIDVPPLRERQEDIFPLAWHFLKHYNQKYKQSKTLSPELIDIIESCSWPGNVRELQNIIERIVVTSDSDVINPEHLPPSVYQRGRKHEDYSGSEPSSGIIPLRHAKEQAERTMLVQALKMKQTTREIAGLLDIDHSTVIRKLRKYGLSGAKKHQKSS